MNRVVPGRIAGVLLLESRFLEDARGAFFESFNQREFQKLSGQDVSFVQDNHSHSRRHVLRGLHYQVRRPQGKLVRVVVGEVFDVAVDVRPDSPTFGKWAGEVLSAANRRQTWLPPGIAHGFLVLSDSAEVLYKTSDYYAPELERCIAWNDPTLAIEWPLHGATPILSAKDAAGKAFAQAELDRPGAGGQPDGGLGNSGQSA